MPSDPLPSAGAGRPAGRDGAYVAVSHVAVPVAGADDLERAFRDRLGEVERWPGFVDLEVWRDRAEEGRYVMVTWWSDEASFRAYLRSDAHERSHARIPTGSERPRPAGLERFEVVAW